MFRHPSKAVQIAKVGAQQLQELSELSKQEVFAICMCHPVINKLLFVGEEEVEAAAGGAGDEEAQLLVHHGEDVRVLLLAQAGQQVVLGQQPQLRVRSLQVAWVQFNKH